MIVQVEMSHNIDMTTHLCTLSPFISGLHLPLVLILSNSSNSPAQSKVRSRGENNDNDKSRERNKEFREEKEVKKAEKKRAS